jgi:hypothetical protein
MYKSPTCYLPQPVGVLYINAKKFQQLCNFILLAHLWLCFDTVKTFPFFNQR